MSNPFGTWHAIANCISELYVCGKFLKFYLFNIHDSFIENRRHFDIHSEREKTNIYIKALIKTRFYVLINK